MLHHVCWHSSCITSYVQWHSCHNNGGRFPRQSKGETMYHRAASIFIIALSVGYMSLSVVDQAAAMARHHHGNGGGTNQSTSGYTGSSSQALTSIDAPAFVTPVPEPSTIILLGSGVLALGLWRYKKQTRD